MKYGVSNSKKIIHQESEPVVLHTINPTWTWRCSVSSLTLQVVCCQTNLKLLLIVGAVCLMMIIACRMFCFCCSAETGGWELCVESWFPFFPPFLVGGTYYLCWRIRFLIHFNAWCQNTKILAESSSVNIDENFFYLRNKIIRYFYNWPLDKCSDQAEKHKQY